MNHSRQENTDFRLPVRWHWSEVLSIGFLTGVFLLLGVGAIMFSLRSFYQPNPIELTNPPLIVTATFTIIEGLAILLAFNIILSWKRRPLFATLDLLAPKPIWFAIAILLALAAIPVIGAIALLVQELLGLPPENPQLKILAPDGVSLLASLLMFLAGGVLVPIAEEFFFRGLLHRYLRQYWSFIPAAILSSVTFGLLHGELSIAAATFFMGMLMAWVYERSRSLWPAIIIHITNNSIKLFLLYAMLLMGIELPPGL